MPVVVSREARTSLILGRREHRTKLILTRATKVVQAGSMSNAAFQRAIEGLESLFNEIKDVPHDVGPNSNAARRNTTEQVYG